ncbi:hypothetical protein B0H66DRAFT_610947 [Apodospora peruviana]|uniref:Uncharacterized protein n=1 Tax=Apodospora peruviana TaxID=516989 RepID=A0AAE0IRQ8_9PEZI|nr:hypothetical protein B0H66DRAFT_610947 [Apodospora peruviana]
MVLKLYFIDPSCDEAVAGSFESYIHEARYLAKRAAERLQNPKDTDFARVFNVIFKTPKTDTAKYLGGPSLWQHMREFSEDWEPKTVYEQTLFVLIDFATSWTRTNDREAAHVRIYADHGARWEINAADSTDGYDPVNHLILTGDFDNLIQGQAFTCWMKPKDDTLMSNENSERTTIDLCSSILDGLIDQEASAPMSLQDFTAGRNQQWVAKQGGKINIGDLGEHLLTRIIFHEFMHCAEYGLDDAPADADSERLTSGWAYCMSLKKKTASASAESMAYLALWAGMAEGGYTMDRRWDAVPGSNGLPDVGDFSDDELNEDEREKAAEDRKKRENNHKWAEDHPHNGCVRGEMTFYEGLTQ